MTRTKSRYLALIAVLLSPMAAHAIPVEITGTTSSDGAWDVSLCDNSYSECFPQLVDQEWWGDAGLAEVFAVATGDVFGTLDQGEFDEPGPLFAWGVDEDGWMAASFFLGSGGTWSCSGGPCLDGTFGRFWAVAERVNVPEPTTLALLGIGLFGMGLARRRKKV